MFVYEDKNNLSKNKMQFSKNEYMYLLQGEKNISNQFDPTSSFFLPNANLPLVKVLNPGVLTNLCISRYV